MGKDKSPKELLKEAFREAKKRDRERQEENYRGRMHRELYPGLTEEEVKTLDLLEDRLAEAESDSACESIRAAQKAIIGEQKGGGSRP